MAPTVSLMRDPARTYRRIDRIDHAVFVADPGTAPTSEWMYFIEWKKRAKQENSYISASEAGRRDDAGLFGHFWAYGARARGRDPNDPEVWSAGERVGLLPGYHANGMWTVGAVLQAEFVGRDKKRSSNRWRYLIKYEGWSMRYNEWRDAEDFTVGPEVVKFWEAADLKDHQGSDDAEGFEVGENVYLRPGEKKRLIRMSRNQELHMGSDDGSDLTDLEELELEREVGDW